MKISANDKCMIHNEITNVCIGISRLEKTLDKLDPINEVVIELEKPEAFMSSLILLRQIIDVFWVDLQMMNHELNEVAE